MQIHNFSLHRKINAVGRANFFAGTTKRAIFNIDGSRFWAANAEWNKCSFAAYQSKLILVAYIDRAGFFAKLAGGTIFNMYITWLPGYFCSEFIIAEFADIAHFCTCEYGDIRVA